MFKINKELLKEMIAGKYIISQTHPTLPLTIYNYSKSCQYEKKWNEITLMARGLVLDNEFNVIAIPFKKFFNYEEHDNKELPLIPTNEKFEVFEKMDGSLGIVFRYNGELIISTRGSFISEQAIKAREIIKKYDESLLIEGFTYLYEIIFPANRIVCDYGSDEELVMLGAINTSTGIEVDYLSIVEKFHPVFPVVKCYGSSNVIDFKKLQEENVENREGYVLKFESGFRVKVKFKDYCRLHSIVTNITARDIWYMLKEGKDLNELLDNVPDEFFDWVNSVIKRLKMKHFSIKADGIKVYHEVLMESQRGKFTTTVSKKDFAILLNSEKYTKNKILKGIAFLYFDGKHDRVDEVIWASIRPEHETPFLNK